MVSFDRFDTFSLPICAWELPMGGRTHFSLMGLKKWNFFPYLALCCIRSPYSACIHFWSFNPKRLLLRHVSYLLLIIYLCDIFLFHIILLFYYHFLYYPFVFESGSDYFETYTYIILRLCWWFFSSAPSMDRPKILQPIVVACTILDLVPPRLFLFIMFFV